MSLYAIKQNIASLWQNTFCRFILIGILNTVFGYGVYACFVLLGVDYRISLTISTILGILFNFKTTGHIVFKNKNNKLIYKFFGVYLLIYCMNQITLITLVSFGINALLSQAVLLPFIVFGSFSLNKRWVFI